MKKKRGRTEVLANEPSASSSREPSFSVHVERSLDVALAQGNKFVSVPQLPWETGFLRDVLGSPGSFAPPWLSPLVLPRNLPSVNAQPSVITMDVHEKKSLVRAHYQDRMTAGLNDKRQTILAKWVDLVLLHPQDSRLGQLLLSCVGQPDCERAIAQLVEDWLARKSTSTLQVRASSFAMYVSFVRKYVGDVAIIPIDEEHVYRYVAHLRSSQKPPTRAQTFVSTLSFVGAVFGWAGAEDAANSQRVQGAAHLCYLRKRVLRQAPPLDIVAIIILELCCLFELDNFLRGSAGLCLLALYGRLRVSDCSRISHGKILGDYFEGSFGTLEKLGAAEMTERLGECLAKLLPKEAFKHYTSHSLKCTLLTYTNVFGLTLEQNELLGYHVVKGHASALNYSRDALASPIRAMMTMLESVKQGTFRPLSVRGSHFVDLSQAVSVRAQFSESTGYSLDEAALLFASEVAMQNENSYEAFKDKMSLLGESEFGRIDGPCNRVNMNVSLGGMDSDLEAEDDESSSSDSCSTSAEEGMAAVEEDLMGKAAAGINPHADVCLHAGKSSSKREQFTKDC
ncbi:unnamed protein product [Cladocopium goreaui]|uniref:Multidrug resistance protein 1A n=1 Tax=Cladocopium goreaui TaxID=2562237 RepID=A0A9P1G8P1_9DINO|nr:unnamed protein product [Cladocopium goreaui]